MQDIPRNELLDKLNAGWKVRRKYWGGGIFLNTSVKHDLSILLENDWEGEPPEPALRDCFVNVIRAFAELRNGQKFIRRTEWADRRILYGGDYVNLAIDDILANDWEVWG